MKILTLLTLSALAVLGSFACSSPARTSTTPSREVTRRTPRSTTVYSSKSGVCPGSTQPDGLFDDLGLVAGGFDDRRRAEVVGMALF
jgi:hypothetical protein